jgi:hypothetical protein
MLQRRNIDVTIVSLSIPFIKIKTPWRQEVFSECSDIILKC